MKASLPAMTMAIWPIGNYHVLAEAIRQHQRLLDIAA